MIHKRIEKFQRSVTMSRDEIGLDLQQMLKHMRDDQYIDETFLSDKDENEEEVDGGATGKANQENSIKQQDSYFKRLNTTEKDKILEKQIGESQFALTRLLTVGPADLLLEDSLRRSFDLNDGSNGQEENVGNQIAQYMPRKFNKMTLEEREQIKQLIVQQGFEISFGTLGDIINKSLTTEDYFKERGFVFSEPKPLPEPPQ